MSKSTSHTTFSPRKTANSGRGRRSTGTGQLTLIEFAGVDWRLDDHTRAVGRAGLAQARAALAAANPAPAATNLESDTTSQAA